MKRILIPTDFSDNARNAIDYALELFKSEECKFFFLHTYTIPYLGIDYLTVAGNDFKKIEADIKKEADSNLAKLIDELLRDYSNPKHTYKTISAFNILTDEINDIVEDEDIDLIIMGTKGATGAKSILFGTNTVFVMRKASCPVLAIPENFRFREIMEILFASDYLVFYKRREIKMLLHLATANNAQITVMHMEEENKLSVNQIKNKEFIDECCEGVNHNFIKLKDKNLSLAIDHYLENHPTDMLAMMNRKHSLLERLLLRQNIEKIGFKIKIPFLVMKDTGRLRG
ncbi:universal stress protein [Abyssalbus ytuae]|uniref:Universal stress protein n=1 Tax=Abyssalbus ytuae TaxID=2926907 RepID=A0A9E6ZU97_9FLAO|nr:universal stress protein [Abyssalbus ytuae]UOB17923.1 universal stress protein [Abyssalbus ytuae]